MYAGLLLSVPEHSFSLQRDCSTARRVTTPHWRYLDLLIKRYKHLQVERDLIFIKDGKFYTTAGVSAGIDLALALVEEDLGHELAASVARDRALSATARQSGAIEHFARSTSNNEAHTYARPSGSC